MIKDPIHGGALDQIRHRFPQAPSPWLDLSTGINPWPYPHTEWPAEALTHLPTAAMTEACRSAMSEAWECDPSCILPVPGSELAIRLLPQLLNIGTIAVPHPIYGDHLNVWRDAGRKVIPMTDPSQIPSDAQALVLCNPNNPDGRLWSFDTLKAFHGEMLRRGGWLILDEAYGELLTGDGITPEAGADGLIILRSFGKFYGLAGLRLGALLGPQSILKPAKQALGVWPISGPALTIGTRAYQDKDWQDATRMRLATARQSLDEALAALGLATITGTDLFRYVHILNAHQVWEKLCAQGVYVRRFADQPDHLRIGLPETERDQDRLVTALKLSLSA